MSTDTDTAVRSEIVVEAPIERAFSVFTEEMETWWNPDHHLIETVEMVVEPRVGGRIYDRGADGSECQWSRVLAWEPPSLFVFSWDINTRWEIETDPEKTSEVAVTFTAEAPDRTRVALEHRHLDRHGEGWEGMRDAVGSGWADLGDYAAAAEGNAPYAGGAGGAGGRA
jgi:uncharacterized protein YndB with AHSA1/START domain